MRSTRLSADDRAFRNEKAYLKRLREIQELTPEQRVRWVAEAGQKFLRKHPEILQLGPTPSEAMRIYCAKKHKKLELELVRDKRGRRSLQVIEVPWPRGGARR